jgi:hypothetical protein
VFFLSYVEKRRANIDIARCRRQISITGSEESI